MTKKIASVAASLKKNIKSIGLCVAITFLCVGTMWLHYSGRGGVISSLITTVETRLLDMRFQLRGPIKPSGKVGILAIDEKTIQRFGRFPFSRTWYEQALGNLKDLGAGWIGFDVTFSEPERPMLAEAIPVLDRIKANGGRNAADWDEIASLNTNSLADQVLFRTLKNYEKTVMGFFYYAKDWEAKALGENPFTTLDRMAEASAIQVLITPDGKELKDYPALNATAAVGNTPYLTDAGGGFAFFNNESDEDAIMRWVTLVRSINGSLMPSLSLKTAAQGLGREIVVFFDRYGVEEVALVNPDDDKDVVKIPVDPEGYGRILINHYGAGETIPHFSLADAYDNKFTPEQKKALKGMTLLLGPTAIAINDQRANPFDAGINGVENHAAVVENIFSQKFMRRPVDIYKTELLLVIAISLIFSPMMIYTRAAHSGIAAVLFMVGYFYFDKYYWFSRGTWAYIGMPYMNIAALFIGVTLLKYVTEEKERKKVSGAFAFYLSPDVIDQMLEDPEALKLGGVKKELTVFFSDVRSFTTISENLDAEKLGQLMNAYFTPMEALIKQSGGTLDKYIGDAIMAFWGAPVAMPDSADRAAISAVKMMFALDKIRSDFAQRGLPKIDIGIGLNTGIMSVGNFGSDERFCYTVMGDEVNLGARLEGLTKEYGIKIMISEKTQRKLTVKELITRDLDDIRVKGKNEPVKVFELIRPDYLQTEQAIRDLVGEFVLGREAYRAQNWTQAIKHMHQCLTIKPDDGPAAMYIERIKERQAEPVMDHWDGVYTFKHK